MVADAHAQPASLDDSQPRALDDVQSVAFDDGPSVVLEARCSNEGKFVPLDRVGVWVAIRNRSTDKRVWAPRELINDQGVTFMVEAPDGEPYEARFPRIPHHEPHAPPFALLLPGDVSGYLFGVGRRIVPTPEPPTTITIRARYARRFAPPPTPLGAELAPEVLTTPPLIMEIASSSPATSAPSSSR
jgi:hypothetical protein